MYIISQNIFERLMTAIIERYTGYSTKNLNGLRTVHSSVAGIS